MDCTAPVRRGEMCCLRSGVLKRNHVVVSFFFKHIFYPYLGKWSNLKSMFFQMGGLKPPISETKSLKLFAPVERRERIWTILCVWGFTNMISYNSCIYIYIYLYLYLYFAFTSMIYQYTSTSAKSFSSTVFRGKRVRFGEMESVNCPNQIPEMQRGSEWWGLRGLNGWWNEDYRNADGIHWKLNKWWGLLGLYFTHWQVCVFYLDRWNQHKSTS